MDNYKQFKFFQNKVKQFQYNFSNCLKRDTILNNSILKLFKQFWTSWNDQVADAYLQTFVAKPVTAPSSLCSAKTKTGERRANPTLQTRVAKAIATTWPKRINRFFGLTDW